MEKSAKDLDSLINFLEFAKANGYIHEGTANNRIRVVKEIFSKVPSIDTSDVSNIDLDALYSRYSILTANQINPGTLAGYKSHLKSAVREFVEYLTNPSGYKPKIKGTLKPSKPTKEVKTSSKVKISNQGGASDKENKEQNLKEGNNGISPTIHIDFQIHISPDTDPTLVDKIFESLSKYFPCDK